MSDVSPLALMFAMFIACLLLVLAGVAVWGFGHLKRTRLTRAIGQLGEILNLTSEALRTHSPDKQNAVNSRIAEWDEVYSRDLGVTIRQFSWI
jgi:hypothetical protein